MFSQGKRPLSENYFIAIYNMQHQKLIRIEYFKNTMTINKPNENGIYVFISFHLKFSAKIV